MGMVLACEKNGFHYHTVRGVWKAKNNGARTFQSGLRYYKAAQN